MASYGFVYLLSHDYMPYVYKLGYTDRAPMQRLKELSASTSIPTDFNLVVYAECENPSSIEANVHKQLEDYRINQQREFFYFGDDFIINSIIPWFKKISINYTECEGLNNIKNRTDELTIPFSDDEFKEEEITEEIADKAAEVIASISTASGEDNA